MPIHFETIWNEAESVSKSFTDLNRKEILKKLRAGVDDLADADEAGEYSDALGSILFELCALCAHLEDKKSMQINSALALSNTIKNKREEIIKQPKPQ